MKRRTGTGRGANQRGSNYPDKGVSMRFIPTKFHAPLDYIVGAALIAAPWIFQFSEHTAATIVLDRAGHRADRLQPVHELRARRLESGADGRAQPDRHRRRHPPRRLAVDLRLRRRVGQRVGCRSWSSASPRSSSASPPCSRVATRTARAQHADHGCRLLLRARGGVPRRALELHRSAKPFPRPMDAKWRLRGKHAR